MDRSLRADRGLAAAAVLVAGLALLAAWAAWAFFSRVTRYEVSDSARLEVHGAASPVEAALTGTVASSSLALGRHVDAGVILVQLEDRDQQLALRQEQTHHAELERQLVALQNQVQSEEAGQRQEQHVLAYAKGGAASQVQQARAQATLAAETFQRSRTLRAEGLISEADFERAHAEADSQRAAAETMAQAELRLEPELDVRNADRASRQSQILTDIASLQTNIATSTSTLDRLRFDIEKRKLRADVAGRLTECLVLHRGAHIAEGQQLGIILPAGQVEMIAEFNPASAFGKLHPGQPATIRLDGFPWAQFGTLPATVSRVAGEVHNRKVYVELALDPSASASPISPGHIPLQHGLPGTVEVAVERVSPMALLLRSAGQAIGAP